MISGLIESKRRAPRRRGGMVVSVVIHSAVIGLAVVATGSASLGVDAREKPDVLVWVRAEPSPVHSAAPASGARSAAATASAPAGSADVPLPELPDLSIVPTGIPPVDVGRPGVAADALRQLATHGGGGGGTSGGAPAIGAPWAEHQVDRPVLALPGSATPRYPEMLRAAGVVGRVVARFVVDTAGRVEPGSLTVVASAHPQFTAAVEAALPRMRFRPAEAAGKKVRQLVEQPFEFEVR